MEKFAPGTVVLQRTSSASPPLFLLTLADDSDIKSAYFCAVVLYNGDNEADLSMQAGQINIWPISQFTRSSWLELQQEAG